MPRVFRREGANARTLGQIYLAVVQLIMLYVLEMWFMKMCIGEVLGRFHYRVSHRMTGRKPKRGRDRVWVYTLLVDAMVDMGLKDVDT